MPKVRFKILYGYSREFINFLAENNYNLENILPIELGYEVTANAADYRRIAGKAKKFQCRTKILYKKGIYFSFAKLLKRKGIYAGCVLFLMLSYVFSLMVWKVEIHTTDDGIKSSVISTLFENDVYPGVFYPAEKMEILKRNIMRENKNIGYIAFNFYKGVLQCEIYPVNHSENYKKNKTEYNIYAELSGVITDLRVYSGYTSLQPGQSVTRGDLLVSNVITTKYEYTSTSLTDAYIEGICKKEYSIFIPFEKEIKLLTGKMLTEKTLYFMGKEYKIIKADKQGEYTHRTGLKNLNISGFNLPATIKTDTYYLLENTKINYDLPMALDKGKTALNTIIVNDVKLKKELSRNYSYRLQEDGVNLYCVTEGYYQMT